MAPYGAPESNSTEGFAVATLFFSVALWVIAWAYLDGALQVVLFVIGILGTVASGYLMVLSKQTKKST
jgi:uncharacterized membrane protein